jgi:hypothetical protein
MTRQDFKKSPIRSKAPEDKRSEQVHCKVTPKESLEISMTAKKCGMCVSSYLRSRALGYEPIARLSADEIDLITKLSQCRADIANFTNAINGLSSEDKIKLFHNRVLMEQWYSEVVPIADAVSEFICDVRNMKMLRPRTTNNKEKESEL